VVAVNKNQWLSGQVSWLTIAQSWVRTPLLPVKKKLAFWIAVMVNFLELAV
jgi:hypothetical protein